MCRQISLQGGAFMTNTTTIRLSRQLYNLITISAKEQNENIQQFIEEAVNEYKKKKFFEKMNAAYEDLKNNKELSDENNQEQEEWDTVLSDGLEEHEWK
jgi:molybdopterin converting factor small subunit